MEEIKEQEKKYCVYKHTSPSGKSYIGITSKSPIQRWKNGKGYSHNKHFSNAINYYGWDNFSHDILAKDLTEEEAYTMEVELIKKYDTFNSEHGYNGTTGGEIGKQLSDEVRKAQSELAKKMWEDEEFKEKMSELARTRTGEKNPNYGNHKLAGENNYMYSKSHTEESIKKMREAALNMSEGQKKAISDAQKKLWANEEYREKWISNKLAHPVEVTEESRKKMSDSQKQRWNDELREEWSKKFSGENNGMYGKHHSEETKQKIKEKTSGENSVWFGKHHTEESKQKSHDSCTWKVSVVQLTLQGEFVSEFDSYSFAAKSVNGIASCIVQCCNGDLKSAYGFIWIKKENYDPNNNVQYRNNKYKSVVQLNNDWEYINTFINLHEAERNTGAHHQNIQRCCKNKGIYKTKGFRYMYEEDYIKLKEEKEK